MRGSTTSATPPVIAWLYGLASFQKLLAICIVFYLLGIGLCFWGTGAIFVQDSDARFVTSPGWFWALGSTLIHMGILMFTYWLKNMDPYPLEPKFLFAAVDLLVAICCGLVVGGLTASSAENCMANSMALLMLTNWLLVLAYLVVLYKYIRIALEIVNGSRNADGSLVLA